MGKIILLLCTLCTLLSCKAEEPELYKQYQYIMSNNDINWDAIDIDTAVCISNTTDSITARNWQTYRYYINDTTYYQVEYFHYKEDTIINYIEYVAPRIDENIKKFLEYAGCNSGYKKYKGKYVAKEKELKCPFDYNEEQSCWLRHLANKNISLLYTTL